MPPGNDDVAAVTFSVKELLTKIEDKIDALTRVIDTRFERIDNRVEELERAPNPIVNGELRMVTVETHVAEHGTRIASLETEVNRSSTVALFKDRALAKGVALMTVFGAVFGIAATIVRAIL